MKKFYEILVAVFAAIIIIITGCMSTDAPTKESVLPESPVPSATHTPFPTPEPTAVPTDTPVPTITTVPAPTETPLPPPPQPMETLSPSPVPLYSVTVKKLLLIDDDGRIYAPGMLGGVEKTLVLGTADGTLVGAFEPAGPLGLDAENDLLYVDLDANGVAVIDTKTGMLRNTIPLPGSQTVAGSMVEGNPAPLADPATGHVLAFRDHVVYVADPTTGQVVQEIPFDDLEMIGCSGPREEDGIIQRALFDPTRQILYVIYVSYSCVPYIGETIISYDVEVGVEITRSGATQPNMTPFDGYLYGTGFYRMGIGYVWAWKDGKPWFNSSDWSGYTPGFTVDPNRDWLYEFTNADNLRVFDRHTMALLFAVNLPEFDEYWLAGYDPVSDNLYFLSVEGELRAWSAGNIEEPAPEPLEAAAPPETVVREVFVSPSWPEDEILFGLWQPPEIMLGAVLGDCFGLGQTGGLLYISEDGGETWSRSVGGLHGGCEHISTLATSPNYAKDRMLLAGVVGMNAFKSVNGGRLWMPSSRGLLGAGITGIYFSPGFADDHTILANTRTEGPHVSTDGSKTWQPMEQKSAHVAMSPEFDTDRTLMYTAYVEGGTSAVYISTDAGGTWQQVGSSPAGITFSGLKLAPEFGKWGVVFVHGSDGMLYRSADTGRTWTGVLTASSDAHNVASMQLVYAPDIEVNRPLFLLATLMDYSTAPPEVKGTLYHSPDGGQNWSKVKFTGDFSPTALAISPAFAKDGILFLGTSDGRVVRHKWEK